MCDIDKAIEECGEFLSSLGQNVRCDIRPYHDEKEDESGYSLTLSVRHPGGSWYTVDSNHRCPTNGMSYSDMVEDIEKTVRSRVALGIRLSQLGKMLRKDARW